MSHLRAYGPGLVSRLTWAVLWQVSATDYSNEAFFRQQEKALRSRFLGLMVPPWCVLEEQHSRSQALLKLSGVH